MSHGRFVWCDLSTTDVEASRAFYTEVIGWGTHGGQVVNGPMGVPGDDMIAQCVDPQGAFFALHMRGSA